MNLRQHKVGLLLLLSGLIAAGGIWLLVVSSLPGQAASTTATVYDYVGASSTTSSSPSNVAVPEIYLNGNRSNGNRAWCIQREGHSFPPTGESYTSVENHSGLSDRQYKALCYATYYGPGGTKHNHSLTGWDCCGDQDSDGHDSPMETYNFKHAIWILAGCGDPWIEGNPDTYNRIWKIVNDSNYAADHATGNEEWYNSATVWAPNSSGIQRLIVTGEAVATLRIKKKVTVNGSASNVGDYVDGTYQFTVTGPGNYSKTVRITVNNGQSNTALVGDNLTPGTYTVTEVPPSGGITITGSSSQSITLNAGDDKTAEFTNNKDLTGKLELTKTITHDPEIYGQPTLNPSGAVFALYKDAACTDLYATMPATDNNGFTSLDNIPTTQSGKTYYLKEITAPNGCIYETNQSNVVIKDKSDQAKTSVSKTNHEFYGYAGAIKRSDIDDTQIKKAGFEFKLYKSDKTTLIETKTTDNNGVVTFSKKLAEGTYYVKETAVPEPFEIESSWHQIVIKQKDQTANADPSNKGDSTNTVTAGPEAGKNNLVVTYIKNKQYGHIKVSKINKETGQVIKKAGFEFSLSGTEISGTKTATTDANGIAVFKNLRVPGSYTLKETKVPGSPWNLSTETKTINLIADGNLGKISQGHTDPNISPVVANVWFEDYGDRPQYGRATLTKTDILDKHKQNGAKFQVILKDAKIEYTSQGEAGRTTSCGFPVAKTTKLTQGSVTFNETNGTFQVNNPIVFVDANGHDVTDFTTANGTLTTGYLPIGENGEAHYALVEIQASNGHLINAHEIPFTLKYDPSKKDNESVVPAEQPKQDEHPNQIDLYKKAKKDGQPIQGVTIGFWTQANDVKITPDAGKDAYVLRTPNNTIQPHAYYVIDGGDIDGTQIAEGYVVHLVHQNNPDIVLDIDNTKVEHAPLGTYNVTLKRKSDDKTLDYTGPSTIETKDGSATIIKVTASTLTGKNMLEATIGEIQNREAVMTWDSTNNAWVTKSMRPHSYYQIEIDRKIVKIISTSEEGGKTWFGRYSTTDSAYFANHYLDQAALPKSDSNILTHATLSGEDHPYVIVTDAQGHINVKRIPFGTYTVAEVKPAVDPVTHKSWLVDTTPQHFEVNSTTGYIKNLDTKSDYAKSQSFEFTDDNTKLDLSKKEVTDGPEIPGATLVLTADNDDEIERWVSTEEPHRIDNLIPGSYTLTEYLTPKDYDKATSVKFTLLPTGDVTHVTMVDTPISIEAQIDKKQEIARPLDERYEPISEENNAEQQSNEEGLYSYSLDFRSNSNTWTDEFTVEDPLEPANQGYANLVSLITPQAFQDYDGKMNVWYKTNKTPEDYLETTTVEKRVDTKKENTDKENADGEENENEEESSDSSSTPDINLPTLKAIEEGGTTVTVDDDDADIIKTFSFTINKKSIGKIQPTVGSYDAIFPTKRDLRLAPKPSIDGIEDKEGWTATITQGSLNTTNNTIPNTITIKHGTKTYAYTITYKLPEVEEGEEAPAAPTKDTKGMNNATISDGHENPWLSDTTAMGENDPDGDYRVIDYKGWKIWEEGVDTFTAKKLNVSDLGLAADEHITGIRFEYGRVEVGFTTRTEDWNRENLKDPHDDMNQIQGANGETFDDPTGSAKAAQEKLNTISERFTKDASQEVIEAAAKARKKAEQDYEDKLIDIEVYNAKLSEMAEGTLPKFAEKLVKPAFPGDADSVTALDTALEAAKASLDGAFSLGSTPLARVALLEAAETVAGTDLTSYVSEATITRVVEAAKAYSVAMDKVPVAAGGADLDAAATNLKEALFAALDEVRLTGLSGRVPYAPAVIQMRLTSAYVEGVELRNSAKVDAYRNGGNSKDKQDEGKLEGHDRDEVIQRLRKKDIHIGTQLRGSRGEKSFESDGSAPITLIDTVAYHGLTPGHEYVMKGELHRKKIVRGQVIDDGVIAGSSASARFTPTAPDGTVDVTLRLPAGTDNLFPTVAYEELYVILPETGGPSPYTLAEHKDINDNGQTVNVSGPAADLVKTGDTIVGVLSLTTVIASGSLMWIVSKRRKMA